MNKSVTVLSCCDWQLTCTHSNVLTGLYLLLLSELLCYHDNILSHTNIIKFLTVLWFFTSCVAYAARAAPIWGLGVPIALVI